MQIQISWLLQKPSDLELHCLQRQEISETSRTTVETVTRVLIFTKVSNSDLLMFEVIWSGNLYALLKFDMKLSNVPELETISAKVDCFIQVFMSLSTIFQSYRQGAGVILELSDREKFGDNFRISGRSFGPNFGFPYTYFTFSLLPQLKIGRNQPA